MSRRGPPFFAKFPCPELPIMTLILGIIEIICICEQVEPELRPYHLGAQKWRLMACIHGRNARDINEITNKKPTRNQKKRAISRTRVISGTKP
jgi:hypothetical protein